MKNLTALLLCLMLLCSCALADTVLVPSSGLTLDIGSLYRYELTDEDAEDDIVLWYGNGDTMDAWVYVYKNSEWTMEELVADLESIEDDDSILSRGLTQINGIDLYVLEELINEDTYISYFTVAKGHLVQFTAWYNGSDGARLVNDVISTLQKSAGSGIKSSLSSMLERYTAPQSGVTAIEHTNLTIDLTGTTPVPLDEEDIADDMVLWFINDDESLDCSIWTYSTGGDSLAALVAEVDEDDGFISGGYTTINGLDVYAWTGTADDAVLLEYLTIDRGMYVQISYLCYTEDAMRQAEQITSTLTK